MAMMARICARPALLLACLAGLTAAAPLAQRVAEADRLSWGVTADVIDDPRGNHDVFTAGDPTLPPAAVAQIAAMRITRTPFVDLAGELDRQRRAFEEEADPARKRAAREVWQAAMNDLLREARTRSVLRDLYSPAQLQEQLTWFWFNHFNVDARKREIRVTVADYEDTIRARVFGRFRDLLGATLHHPAMLQYLDNDHNALGHVNENYAREILELHTLGLAEHSYGQSDVQELARILTGVGIRFAPDVPRLRPDLARFYRREGLFEFNPQRHDFGDKHFLGATIHGQGMAEVDQALDMIARAPATARHVSQRLALFFLGTPPSPALVARMAATWQRSDGRIDEVLRTLFASAEFRASLTPAAAGAFKDPVHYALSAVRYTYGGGPVIRDAGPLLGWLDRMGEPLFARETPDGYPLEAAAWTGPGQMEVRLEIARTLGGGAAGLFRSRDPAEATLPAFPQLQNALWFDDLKRQAAPATLAALGQATSPQEWNMLFLASPEFMRR